MAVLYPTTDTSGNPIQDQMFNSYVQQNQNTINPNPNANPNAPTTSPFGVVSAVSPTGTGGGSNSQTVAYPNPSAVQTGAYGGNGAAPAGTPTTTAVGAYNPNAIPPNGNYADPNFVTSQVTAWMQANGITPGPPGSGQGDVSYWSSKIEGTGGWTPNNAGYFENLMTQNVGGDAGGAGAASGTAANGYGTNTTSAIDPTQSNAIFQQLMQQAQQSTDVNPNDPVIKAQTDAFAAQESNAAKNQESAAAESQGGTAYNPEATTRSMAEAAGQAEGAFTGQAMSNELAARRQMIEQALSGAAGLITNEQQMALQEELSKLNLAQSAYTTDQSNLLAASGL